MSSLFIHTENLLQPEYFKNFSWINYRMVSNFWGCFIFTFFVIDNKTLKIKDWNSHILVHAHLHTCSTAIVWQSRKNGPSPISPGSITWPFWASFFNCTVTNNSWSEQRCQGNKEEAKKKGEYMYTKLRARDHMEW